MPYSSTNIHYKKARKILRDAIEDGVVNPEATPKAYWSTVMTHALLSLRIIKEHGPINQSQIMERLGFRTSFISLICYELADAGLVEKKRGWNGCWLFY